MSKIKRLGNRYRKNWYINQLSPEELRNHILKKIVSLTMDTPADIWTYDKKEEREK